MTVRSFVDTNVLFYAEDLDAGAKRDRAQALLRELVVSKSAVLSLQVLREFFAASRAKLGLDAGEAKRRTEIYSRLEVVELSLEDLMAAIDLHRLHQFSIWDALIVRAALIGRCRVLYSEDLQHGQRIDRLEIRNPFAG
ncbi:MAG TPA: PIN domain-containing protein, partial [Thermoanaerobaculia bacterium]|nr:PIN domain-containing protein [Thermoanaerobaculia bacterium]